MNKEDTREAGLVLMDEGEEVLHAIKDRLDQAKMAFDEGRVHYEAERWVESLEALMRANKFMLSIPPMIIGTLTEEDDAGDTKA